KLTSRLAFPGFQILEFIAEKGKRKIRLNRLALNERKERANIGAGPLHGQIPGSRSLGRDVAGSKQRTAQGRGGPVEEFSTGVHGSRSLGCRRDEFLSTYAQIFDREDSESVENGYSHSVLRSQSPFLWVQAPRSARPVPIFATDSL